MAYNYMIPTVTLLPPGYMCRFILPLGGIAEAILEPSSTVRWLWTIYCDGKAHSTGQREFEYRNGRFADVPDPVNEWRLDPETMGNQAAYLEMWLESADGSAIFADKLPVSAYVSLSAPGQKSVFSDSAMKYGLPAIIAQIAAYGTFLDGYPVVRLDRDRDAGESLAFINPYRKAIIARILASNGRSIERVRLEPNSARIVPLTDLLGDADQWVGQVQFTANNRIIAFNVKHSLSNPASIHHIEHSDVFRGEATHLPAFQLLRQKVGAALAFRSKNRLQERLTDANTTIEP